MASKPDNANSATKPPHPLPLSRGGERGGRPFATHRQHDQLVTNVTNINKMTNINNMTNGSSP
jgi:hypothetical protein